MRIQHINNVSYKANVKINRGELDNLITATATIAPVATSSVASSGGAAASTVLGTASQVAGTTFDVLGTAFSAKASGINSSGIVPSAMNLAGPHLTGETIASSNNHPSIMGSIMSTIADFFHAPSAIASNNKVKRPS